MVKKVLRWLSGLALLLAPLLAGATTAIFYQPQLRDRAVPQAQWPALFAQVRAQGFDTLVVQWTEYGDAFADPAGHAWLLQRVRDARAAGLRIVLGLGSDPAFFQRQEAAPSALDDYLLTLSRHNAAIAKRWAGELGSDTVAGWYLPIEVDDRRWRDPAARKQLQDYLATERRQLDGILPRPVYVTSFFAGNMTPSRYAELVADIEHAGVRAWVQDGAGTGRLGGGERALYLDAANQCAGSHAHGVVYEIFRQTGEDKAFTAAALPAAEAGTALAQRAPCEGDSAFFELRYLPGVADVFGHP
ncbi:DUF4434 domain-containing protein [Dyella koreensis]|uniref:DUF4434 domain-containing protein n=1 Tax=Dyella koreensis TaxID=311235 RepID=A0ABW8K3H9_9GAMM